MRRSKETGQGNDTFTRCGLRADQKRCFGDGGDCPDGLEVVCGLNEEEQANRMAAGIVHRVDQTEEERG